MNKPPIRYLVSSPYGDIPADENKWDLPLEGDELKTSYRIYFHSIKDFLSQDEFKPFLSSLSQKLGKEIHLKEVNEIIVRTEKHGLLYHPASIEPILKEGRAKFGLNVAISDSGRYWLKEEYGVLQKLHTKFDLPYLPRVYCFSELNALSFLLEDWFEGYHEFHISKDNEGTQRLKLWDFDYGYTYLSSEQSFELYRQASQILTLYYDLSDFSQIFPWHHAGGDFVVKIEDKAIGHPHPNPPPSRGRADRGSPLSREGESISFADKYPPSTGGRGLGGGGINVRLTTARRYEPFIGFVDEDTLNPILALCYYLLNLTIRMRLDKLDGLGESVWVEDFCVEATVQGFLDALRLKDELRFYFNSEDEFFSILRSFTREDIKTIFSPLIDLYKETSDFIVIRKNLDKHIEELHATILQIFPL
jgi:hypothetical protein